MPLPLLGLIAPIVNALGSIGKSWLETRKVKAEGKIQIAAAKVQARVKKEEAKANMDLVAMDGMRYSWKDEYLVILLSAPVILSFIPGLEQYALAGFEILDKTPDWYRWALTGMIAASFGLRTWTGFKK
jgi:hypothetical protein